MVEKIDPIRLHGESRYSIRWDFEMSIPLQTTVSGKVAVGGGRAHEVKFDIKELHDLVKNLTTDRRKPVFRNNSNISPFGLHGLAAYIAVRVR